MAFDATARAAELEQLHETSGWRAIKDIAEPLGVAKPDEGWDEAISLIVEAEQAAALTTGTESKATSEPTKQKQPTPESVAETTDTPWRKARTDLYGNIIPSPWSS